MRPVSLQFNSKYIRKGSQALKNQTLNIFQLADIFPETRLVLREKISETLEQLSDAKFRILDSYWHSLRKPEAGPICEATAEIIYEQEIQPLQRRIKKLSWQHYILTNPKRAKTSTIDKDAVKEATDLNVLAEKTGIRLRKCGDHWIAICPFHQEKNPSLHIWRDHFYCFGCGKCGDIFTFLELKEGIDFKKALEILKTYA